MWEPGAAVPLINSSCRSDDDDVVVSLDEEDNLVQQNVSQLGSLVDWRALTCAPCCMHLHAGCGGVAVVMETCNSEWVFCRRPLL